MPPKTKPKHHVLGATSQTPDIWPGDTVQNQDRVYQFAGDGQYIFLGCVKEKVKLAG